MSDKFLTNEAPATRKRRKAGKPYCVVRFHSISIPVYAFPVAGKTRYTIAFYLNGRRKRRMFTDLETAKREARLAAERIMSGRQAQNDLRPAERESFLAAQRILKGTGVPLVAATEDYAQCRRMLGDTPLRSAVEEFLRNSSSPHRGFSFPIWPSAPSPDCAGRNWRGSTGRR